MKLTGFALLLVCVAPLPATDDVKKKPADADLLVGRWRVTASTYSGLPLPAKEVAKAKPKFQITADTLISIEGDPEKSEVLGKYRIDPTKSPKTFDLLDEKGGVGSVGIYKLDGDTLWLCYHASKDEKYRPAKFASRVREPEISFIMTREKK